jgi:hypothetical protein
MKKCPNCGAMQNESAKFCTSCGAKFAAAESAAPVQQVTSATVSPAQTQTQQQSAPVPPIHAQAQQQAAPSSAKSAVDLDKAKDASMGYWRWLVSSFRHPSSDKIKGHKYYGLISMALIALFATLSVAQSAANGASSVTGSFGSAEQSFFGNSDAADSLGQTASQAILGTAVRMFILVFVLYLIIGTASFILRQLLSGEKRGYLESLTAYSQRLAIVVFGSAIAAILGLIASAATMSIIALLWIVGIAFSNIAFYQIVMTAPHKSRGDVMYVVFGMNVAVMILVAIALVIFGGSVGSMFGSMF